MLILSRVRMKEGERVRERGFVKDAVHFNKNRWHDLRSRFLLCLRHCASHSGWRHCMAACTNPDWFICVKRNTREEMTSVKQSHQTTTSNSYIYSVYTMPFWSARQNILQIWLDATDIDQARWLAGHFTRFRVTTVDGIDILPSMLRTRIDPSSSLCRTTSQILICQFTT